MLSVDVALRRAPGGGVLFIITILCVRRRSAQADGSWMREMGAAESIGLWMGPGAVCNRVMATSCLEPVHSRLVQTSLRLVSNLSISSAYLVA